MDRLYAQREREGRAVPLLWEGRHYLVKIQDDLSGLAESNLAMLLPGFTFRGNPMLLPPNYFRTQPKGHTPQPCEGSDDSVTKTSKTPPPVATPVTLPSLAYTDEPPQRTAPCTLFLR